eukprot:PITA_05059
MASSSKSASISASASTSMADGNICYPYDVFLNHRGSDGKTFASHLYDRLTDHRLRVFLDREEMEKGEGLTPQINGAIRAAYVNIAIFSPQYCQSQWCLDELVLMLECKLKKGSTILPIFLHVEPSVVRWTEGEKGVYGQALTSLQNKRNADSQPRYDPEIIRKWKDALHHVAEISGFELDGKSSYNGDESKLLKDVVEKVLKLVPKPPLYVSIYPTGLEEKVKDFKERLQRHESGKAKVVGIVGLGGIGKTTLAKEFYNRKNKEYRRSIFLSHVRENHSRGELKKLQRQLIKELSGKGEEIYNTDEGIPLLEKHLPHWRALIILDDVDDVEQLRALLPVLPANDSLILVTSRDKSVLQIWELIEDPFIYTLEGLSLQHSVELFCWHAFHQPGPPDAVFEHLVNKFVDACGKLPLSLSVIGALLRGKNPKHWEEQLRKIRKTLPTQIQKILEISYESLDDEEKKIFLDVACLFVGEEKDTAMMIWEHSGWAASLGLETLRNKHLVEVEVVAVWKYGVEYSEGEFMRSYSECRVECIRMHDHLRDMGRYLADKEPSLRRIWSVTENLSDLSPVGGIRDSAERDRRVAELRWRASNGHRYWVEGVFNAGRRGSRQLLEAVLAVFGVNRWTEPNRQLGSCVEGVFNVEQPPQLILLRCYDCPDSSFPPNISTKNLRVLHIEGSNLETLWHLESQAPRELRELYIDGYRLPKIPQSIGQLRRLEKVVLASKGVQGFETLPEQFCQLESLKHLELHENGLKSLPESFWDLSSLQHLNLAGCTCLEELPDSCPNLTKLQHIDLSSCMKLRLLPDSFGNLTNLQHIDLSFCQELETLPNTFGNLMQLKYLSLLRCQGLTIPSEALGNITTLETLYLAECFAELPPQLTYQRFLQELTLSLSSSELPEAIGNLSNLNFLSINSFQLEMLPPLFGDLRSLKHLEFKSCAFKCFPDPIRMLTQLKTLILRTMDLKRLKITEWFSGLPTTLETLQISGCEDMEELEELSGLERLESLKFLRIGDCDGLKRIHGLAQLTKLQRLEVLMNGDLEELPGIEGSQSLKVVLAPSCPKLKREYESSHRTCRYVF